MLHRNLFIVGFAMAILLPTVVFVLLFQVFKLLEINGLASGLKLSPDFRERTLAILAIAVNLWVMTQYRNRRMDNALRGVVVATGILAIGWVFRYAFKMF